MTVRLGTKITAYFLRQQFGRAAEDLSTATQRLASGQRINRPGEDPAGLAIAEKLSTDARIYNQGVRNLNAGISAISVADEALTEMTRVLDRIDEYAKQSQNQTLSQSQRDAIQQEVTALQSEWNRIIESTRYNGTQLLTGNDALMVFQSSPGESGAFTVRIGHEQLSGGMLGYAGGTTVVSTDSAGNLLGDSGRYPADTRISAISADGRYVVFITDANLADGDTDSRDDVFRRDLLTGTTTIVSIDGETAGEGSVGERSYTSAISADGRYVAFTSRVGFRGAPWAFVKDMTTGITTLVSAESAGDASKGSAFANAISADGRYVVFSDNYNYDTGVVDTFRQVFIKDTLTGATTRISTDSAGNEANDGDSTGYAISADGRYIAFTSSATNLVDGDTNGVQDAFVKDLTTGVTTRVSTDSIGTQGDNISAVKAISADGRYIAFTSSASQLVAYDNNGSSDAFIKDTLTGITILISTDSEGVAAGGNSTVTDISADGRYVTFTSTADNLVADDSNGRKDVFMRDMVTGTTMRLNTDSAGNQTDGVDSDIAAISADGRYVVFNSSASGLVPDDGNSAMDVFVKDLSKVGVQQLSGLVVSNRVSAGVTLILTEQARTEVAGYRAILNASLARINSSINTLTNASLNLQEAAARIKDVDLAEEASKAMAARMRQEITANLLKQNNLQASLALLLLKG